MRKRQSTLSHEELAKELEVSRSYVSRLSRAGMPCGSVKEARAWIKQQSEEKGSPAADATLTEWRKNKLQLECRTLEHGLAVKQREFMPVKDIQVLGYAIGQASTEGWQYLLQVGPPTLAGLDETGVYQKLRPLVAEIINEINRRVAEIK